jgi:hypothetical protein
MKNLGGWARLGIVLTLLWTLAVLVELSFEGPFSLQLLTETVVARTGEPVSALDGNQFRDLVPVDQVVKIEKLLSTLLVPILSMWILGLAWTSVRAGFGEKAGRDGPARSGGVPKTLTSGRRFYSAYIAQTPRRPVRKARRNSGRAAGESDSYERLAIRMQEKPRPPGRRAGRGGVIQRRCRGSAKKLFRSAAPAGTICPRGWKREGAPGAGRASGHAIQSFPMR